MTWADESLGNLFVNYREEELERFTVNGAERDVYLGFYLNIDHFYFFHD
jgi:hypothetical protein